jgi:hypothetical protein
MTIHVGIAYPHPPPGPIAEFHIAHDGVMDIPAELFGLDGRVMIGLYSRGDGIAWEYPVSDFLAAIGSGSRVLEGSED